MKFIKAICLLCVLAIISSCGDPMQEIQTPVETEPIAPAETIIYDSDTIEESIIKELDVSSGDTVYRIWKNPLYPLTLSSSYDPSKTFDSVKELKEYVASLYTDLDIDNRNETCNPLYTTLKDGNDFQAVREFGVWPSLPKFSEDGFAILKLALTNPQAVMDRYDPSITVINHYVFSRGMVMEGASDIEMYMETDKGDFVYLFVDHTEKDIVSDEEFLMKAEAFTDYCHEQYGRFLGSFGGTFHSMAGNYILQYSLKD